jgi:hypothetical protein
VRDTPWSLLWLLGATLYALAHILLRGHIGHDEGRLASAAGGIVVSAAEQFGTIGVAFALVSWLFAAAVVLTVTAAIGAVAMERRR